MLHLSDCSHGTPCWHVVVEDMQKRLAWVPTQTLITRVFVGQDSNEVARQAQHLLEHSLLCELHNVVARALSGLDMFEGRQLTEADLCGSEDSQDEPKTLAQVRPFASPCIYY